jgi:small-conductance mechanosensitive channel
VRLYSKKRIDVFSRLIITFLAVILLMAPVIALFGTSQSGVIKILIIFLFTMAFSVALSLCTKAKRHEVFAATAA